MTLIHCDKNKKKNFQTKGERHLSYRKMYWKSVFLLRDMRQMLVLSGVDKPSEAQILT